MHYIYRRHPLDWSSMTLDKFQNDPNSTYNHLSYFKSNLVDMISFWNAIFHVDYFKFRSILSDRSLQNLKKTGKSIITSEDINDLKDGYLFMTDDDDYVRSDVFDFLDDEYDFICWSCVKVCQEICYHSVTMDFKFIHTNNMIISIKLLNELKRYDTVEKMIDNHFLLDRYLADHTLKYTLHSKHIPDFLSVYSQTPASASHYIGRGDAFNVIIDRKYVRSIMNQYKKIDHFPSHLMWFADDYSYVWDLIESTRPRLY